MPLLRWFQRSPVRPSFAFAVAVAAAVGIASGAQAASLGGRSAAAAGGTDESIVRTARSTIHGTVTPTMREFLGIRYAGPPVGAARWAPPQPIPVDPPTVNATAFGPHCPQAASAFGEGSVTEDCLFLNVFTPRCPQNGRGRHTSDERGLPVMVWIHGGAFTSGESDDYDPDKFVAHGVIVVTLNYRLGLLGFFAHPALDATTGPSIDYGLMDQQAALAWVNRNIGAFGGDRKRITIFGESAGGLSVFSQLSSPGASHLFGGALIESGSYQLALPTRAESEAAGTATATALGCSSQTAACLRALPVATLLANEAPMTVPTVDGFVLPKSPDVAFATGAFNHVPIVDGTNHDEYRLFVAGDFDLGPNGPLTAAEYQPLIAASLGNAAAALVVAEYPLSNYPSPDVAFATVVTDFIFSCPALGADGQLAKYVPLYAYEFADENAPEPYLPPVSFPYAAAHASEIQFIWDSFTRVNPPLSSAELKLSESMVDYWSQFGTDGQPNARNTPYWPRFGLSASTAAGGIQTLVPPQPLPGFAAAFAADHKCAFWAALASASPAKTKATLASIRAAARGLRRH